MVGAWPWREDGKGTQGSLVEAQLHSSGPRHSELIVVSPAFFMMLCGDVVGVVWLVVTTSQAAVSLLAWVQRTVAT